MHYAYDWHKNIIGGQGGVDMPRKTAKRSETEVPEGADSDGHLALSLLLHYAAREAAAQNRFTTVELLQAAIASLTEQAAVSSGPEYALSGNVPRGHC
jgi:hypothetical protein